MMEPNIFWVCCMKITIQVERMVLKDKGDEVLQTAACFYRENENKHSSLSANYILLLLPR